MSLKGKDRASGSFGRWRPWPPTFPAGEAITDNVNGCDYTRDDVIESSWDKTSKKPLADRYNKMPSK